MCLWRAVGWETCAYVVLSVQLTPMNNVQGLLFLPVGSDNKSSSKFRTLFRKLLPMFICLKCCRRIFEFSELRTRTESWCCTWETFTKGVPISVYLLDKCLLVSLSETNLRCSDVIQVAEMTKHIRMVLLNSKWPFTAQYESKSCCF